jgi:hypothetical protein
MPTLVQVLLCGYSVLVSKIHIKFRNLTSAIEFFSIEVCHELDVQHLAADHIWTRHLVHSAV